MELVGSSIFVAVSVLTETGKEGAGFSLFDCLSLKNNFADYYVSFVPCRKKGSKYLLFKKKTFWNQCFVMYSSIYFTGGEMVEAELRNIQIVTSPYTISFKRTPKYYKPGMSFDVAVK